MKKIDILNKYINDNINLDDDYEKLLGKIEEIDTGVQPTKKRVNLKMRYAVVFLSCILILIVAIGIPVITNIIDNQNYENNEYIEGYNYLMYNSTKYRSSLNEMDSKYVDVYIDTGYVCDLEHNKLDCEIYSLKGLDTGIAVGIKIYGKDDYFAYYISNYNPIDLHALINDFNLTELANIKGIEDSNKNKFNSNYNDVLEYLGSIDSAYMVDSGISLPSTSYSISFRVEILGLESPIIKLYSNYYIKVKLDYITATFFLGEERYNELIDIINTTI